MPEITDTPPDEIQAELAALQAELDTTIPPRLLDRNLLVATWNIRSFGSVATEWFVDPKSPMRPKRDLHSLMIIAEIVKRFDVIALQEIRGGAEGLQVLIRSLGENWGCLLSDVTEGSAGNMERKAFLFDTRRVVPAGLTCEYVIAPEKLERAQEDELKRQFARTPYVASFRSGKRVFTLVNVHLTYGGGEATGTVKELKMIAEWLREWAEENTVWQSNLIALGDFNIRRKGDPTHAALTSTGLHIPDELYHVRRTVVDDPENPRFFYDQIAWFPKEGGVPGLSLTYTTRGGNFDFVPFVLKSRNIESPHELSFYISDHLPLWCEFSVRD